MNKQKIKQNKRNRIRGKIRSKISGTKECPRLSVFKSNKGMYLQLINDEEGKILVSAHSSEINLSASSSSSKLKTKTGQEKKGKKVVVGFELGKIIAEKALRKKIKKVVFDRGGYKYHGRVKAVADGAREGGLEF